MITTTTEKQFALSYKNVWLHVHVYIYVQEGKEGGWGRGEASIFFLL